MNVLMWATSPNENMARSVESFRRIGGVDPIVIGTGQGHSWQARIAGLHRWCADHPGQLVLSADAYDTCCVRSLPADPEWEGLTFSAETNCWPDPHVASEYPPCDTPYRFLNAGVWWGVTDAYVAMVERHGLLAGVQDDQRSYTRAYLNGGGIAIDHRQQVCHSRFGAEGDCEVIGGTYRVKSTGTTPLMAHGNGSSYIARVWEAFGL